MTISQDKPRQTWDPHKFLEDEIGDHLSYCAEYHDWHQNREEVIACLADSFATHVFEEYPRRHWEDLIELPWLEAEKGDSDFSREVQDLWKLPRGRTVTKGSYIGPQLKRIRGTFKEHELRASFFGVCPGCTSLYMGPELRCHLCGLKLEVI